MGEYIYRALEPGHIRLLHILPAQSGNEGLVECSLSHHEFEENRQTSYSALSYTWGDTTGGRDVLIDGKRMHARPNLYDCLRSLRHHGLSHYVWIDAICINQTDDDEKSAQLKLMGSIYSSADLVIICLKADDDEILAAFFSAAERFRRNYDEDTFPTPHQDNAAIYRAVRWLCQNPYFRRMWIVQENVLAKNRILVCGMRKMPWLYVERMVGEGEAMPPEGIRREDFSQLIRGSGIEHIFKLTPYFLAKSDHPAPTLFNALVRYEQQLCFDRRDKIFALLGLPEMQKPKIQSVCKADYRKDARDLLLDVLEWFEDSPYLSGLHQTHLQRYKLLQDTLGYVDLSEITCRLANSVNSSKLEDFRFVVKFGSGRLSELPTIVAKTSHKGRVTSVSALEDMDKVLDEVGESKEGNIQKQNIELLDELQSEPWLRQLMFGFRSESTDSAIQFIQNHSHRQMPHNEFQKGWENIELNAGGWGIASAGVNVGDLVQAIVVGQTQNNTAICCSLVLRENDEGTFSIVGFAIDHLGFYSANRQKPSQSFMARMPPRRPKGKWNLGIQLAMDPLAAFRLTALTGLRTLGYGWITPEKMTW